MREVAVGRPDGTTSVLTLAPGPAGAPAVLVVPAMGMRARYYLPLLRSLQARGVTAAVTELRGHEAGGRVPGRGYDYGYDELVTDLGAAVGRLRSECPGSPLVVLGHSLGGQVATALAARRPHGVPELAGLALVAAGSVHWRLWGRRHLLLTQAVPLVSALVGHFPGARLGFAGREARGQMRDWARVARTGRLVLGDPPLDHTALAGELRLPVLAVSFDDDVLTTHRSTDGLVAWLTTARVTRHRVPAPAGGAPHFGWVREPAPVTGLVERWLRDAGLCGPSPS